jgi:hypothetical protein
MYDCIMQNDIDVQVIIAGPIEPSFKLANNVLYIKTEDVKPAQCFEIAMRNVSSDLFTAVADDNRLNKNGLDRICEEYLKEEEESGDDNFIIIPRLRAPRLPRRITYEGKNGLAPPVSLAGTIIRSKWFDVIGGVDRRFLAVYWDIDWSMRFYENGGRYILSSSLQMIEPQFAGERRLHKLAQRYDRSIVDSFWVRDAEEGEEVPSDSAWCYSRRGANRVISKKRVQPFEPFEEEGLMEHSQDVKEFRGLKWV